MNNQATPTILSKDIYINTSDNLCSTEKDNQTATPEISQGPHETKTTSSWNWRQEADTAGLFASMWG